MNCGKEKTKLTPFQEEQLKGIFLIVSDSHSISNYQHRMTLTLRYLGEVKESEGESIQ